MNTILPKHMMSEEDIKLHYITPAITAKWSTKKITMETKITDGKINLRGNLISRGPAKRADYLLYLNANNPIAVVEAKDNKHSISYGLQQAKAYAIMLDLPFAYSSNGDGFDEFDFLTGMERTLQMDEFPSEAELIERFRAESNEGTGLTPNQDMVLNQPYFSSQKCYPPRYYQRVAINRVLDAIARGQDRILVVMATGTGKTYTAFQIVYRLLQCGLKHKVLYLADRNILVDQSIQQDFAPLAKVIHKVNVGKDDKSTITSHEVYFSLYQQLVGDDDQEHFSELFQPDFFDLIIVDECHRGSAKDDSRWRRILEYFKGATQIGMTATPKETKYISNVSYFGDPVYTYSLKNGIDDGFLAPFKVINITTDIGDGWRPVHGQKDIFGMEIPDRIYTNSDYDYNIILQDRIHQVAKEITAYLKSTDRMQKTIVFCANEDHAERMRIELNNLNADMCAINPDYVVRITGSDDYGKSKLDYFISVSEPYYLSEAYEEFTMLALIEARRIAQKYRAIYTFIDDEKNEELFKSDLNLTQLMEDWVNNRETDCQSSVDVGEAMIKGMEQFVASASWHCDWIYEGEKKRPFMWFGLNGEKPEEGWILNLEDDPDAETTWKDFWFPDDGWTNRIPDADSIFLTWMEAEVGDFLPSMEDVISTCPIEIDEADDYRALSEKIANILP